MKRLVKAVLILLAGIAPMTPAMAQTGPSMLSRVGGVYFSKAHSYGAYIPIGNVATGNQTITAFPALVTLSCGQVIGSAVSLATSPTGSSVPCESITATFANTHGASFNPQQIISGDQGIQEAINDAANNGGGMVYWEIDSGNVTLNTGGANTSLGSVNIPTRSTVMGAVARVTTTISTCAGGWSLGYSSGTEFTAANTGLTAGTTSDSSTLQPAVAFTYGCSPGDRRIPAETWGPCVRFSKR
jgi:hypothetical protein